ncbi:protein Lines homolog 1 [Aulostomus maculatus]
MERPGSRASAVPQERLDGLTEAFRCLEAASRPRRSAAGLARLILAEVRGPEGGEGTSVELACASLGLVVRMSRRGRNGTPEVALYCREVLTRLLEDLDLMSPLVHLFRSEDQVLSHLAAKCVSACVCSDLIDSGLVRPAWQQTCVLVFHCSPPDAELNSCLWSLTAVLKHLLKRAHGDALGKLLLVFDSSLSVLCSRFLPLEGEQAGQCPEAWAGSSRWGTTLCLLLDLLEVLTASRLTCGAGVCLRSQRLTHIHASPLLMAVSCSSQYFVKKRVLLLLKRVVLGNAGEDWLTGDVLSTGPRNKCVTPDMSSLALSVLQMVATGWLQGVQVEAASFFGGTRHSRGAEDGESNCVMWRAVSLLVLKSIELHIQTGAGLLSPAEVSGYLRTLWDVLRRSNVQLTEVTHSCCFFSLLFGEQDDDMMEAAKALLSISLHLRDGSARLPGSADLEAACTSGCNPHCHFLLLLQSISFDHSMLLDFLISMETCFLEYFVRYLKYLRADWPGFTAVCQRVDKSLPAATHGGTTGSRSCPDQMELSSCVQLGSSPGLRLVEYDSSDESDPDDREVSPEPQRIWLAPKRSGMSGCRKWEVSETSRPPLPVRRPDCLESSEPLSEPNASLEGGRGGSLVVLSGQACPNMVPLSVTSTTAVDCLLKLSEMIARLQMKKLFPYNPSSLLKLLARVQECSQRVNE